MKREQILSLVCLAATLAGCTMIPKYERPPAPVSPSWPSGPAYEHARSTKAVPAAEIGWREFFTDPRLLRLIELSLTNNLDLQTAALNVEVTRAQYRIQRAALLPTVNGNAGLTRERIPGSTFGIPGQNQPIQFTDYSVNASVTAYELDLFGRIRSLKAQALNRYFATEEARKSVQLALVSEVAIQYLSERDLDERLEIARRTLKTVEASFELNRRSFENGIASELDLRTAEAQVQTVQANLAALTLARAQAENALVLLVGHPLPPDLPAPRPLDAQRLLADLPADLPSDLLQRRPDILAAEYQLRAANANIGAARAAFFPRVLLTGSAGTASLRIEDLFTGPAKAWSFSPQITVPIFDAGINRANLDVAKLSRHIEVANYQKTIQTAFREVADALAARATLEVQISALESLAKAEQQRYNLADMRYRGGIDSYLNVLSAQQDLYLAEQRLVQIRAARLSNLVALYKSLGGGWQEQTKPRSTDTARAAK